VDPNPQNWLIDVKPHVSGHSYCSPSADHGGAQTTINRSSPFEWLAMLCQAFGTADFVVTVFDRTIMAAAIWLLQADWLQRKRRNVAPTSRVLAGHHDPCLLLQTAIGIESSSRLDDSQSGRLLRPF
jgi:hypothetical protein